MSTRRPPRMLEGASATKTSSGNKYFSVPNTLFYAHLIIIITDDHVNLPHKSFPPVSLPRPQGEKKTRYILQERLDFEEILHKANSPFPLNYWPCVNISIRVNFPCSSISLNITRHFFHIYYQSFSLFPKTPLTSWVAIRISFCLSLILQRVYLARAYPEGHERLSSS